jgi:hypothetical protein
MSDTKATVQPNKTSFSVQGYEKISYDFHFLDGVFDPANPQLADCYARWKRYLAVMDRNIAALYGGQIRAYFAPRRRAGRSRDQGRRKGQEHRYAPGHRGLDE